MGVDTKISLPPNVRVQDVADVAGLLRGLSFSESTVKGAGVRGFENMPQMCQIHLWRDGSCFASYNFHFENPGGRRVVTCRSTGENIAMARALVGFFGGSVDFNDCDDVRSDYAVSDKSDEENHPEDGAIWQDLQRRKREVRPIGAAEIEACRRLSAYDRED